MSTICLNDSATGICSVAGDSGTSMQRYNDFFMASGYT